MAITITKARGSAYPVGGPTRHNPCTLTPDTSYPAGGYSLTAANFGERKLEYVDIVAANAAGTRYKAVWDTDNLKLRIYQAAGPALLTEEAVTVATHAGTLARVPGYILSVNVTAGGTTGSCRVIPVGETPATGQVAVNLVTGALVFATADAVTAAKVIYIPLGVGPFVEANRVIDESNAGTNDTTRDLAIRAGLIQYVWNDTSGNLPTIVPVGEAPGSGACAIDINNTAVTTITLNAAQDDATFKITYWKHAPLVQYGWTDQADITVTSDVVLFTEVLDIAGVFIPAFGQVIVGETGAAANLQSTMLGPSGAAAANVAVYDPAKNSLTFLNGDAYATNEVTYIVLDAGMLGAGGDVEVGTGDNLSALTFQATAVTTR